MDDFCKADRCCKGKNPSCVIYYDKPVCLKFWNKWGNRLSSEIKKRLNIKEAKRERKTVSKEKDKRNMVLLGYNGGGNIGVAQADNLQGDMGKETEGNSGQDELVRSLRHFKRLAEEQKGKAKG